MQNVENQDFVSGFYEDASDSGLCQNKLKTESVWQILPCCRQRKNKTEIKLK